MTCGVGQHIKFAFLEGIFKIIQECVCIFQKEKNNKEAFFHFGSTLLLFEHYGKKWLCFQEVHDRTSFPFYLDPVVMGHYEKQKKCSGAFDVIAVHSDTVAAGQSSFFLLHI